MWPSDVTLNRPKNHHSSRGRPSAFACLLGKGFLGPRLLLPLLPLSLQQPAKRGPVRARGLSTARSSSSMAPTATAPARATDASRAGRSIAETAAAAVSSPRRCSYCAQPICRRRVSAAHSQRCAISRVRGLRRRRACLLARSPSSSSSSSPSSSSSSSSSSLARRVASSFLLVRRDRRARGGRGGEVDRPIDRPIARPRRVASFVTINYSARRFPLSSFRAAIDRSRD